MALASTTIWEVEQTGSDTLNGGHFDPATGTMATDLAATVATGSSPVVTSASYNFVSGDIGAWLFVRSGTNWTSGWYHIASVAANAATLSAAIGAGVLYVNSVPSSLSTAAGCATTASPTAGTWAIDYSQQAAAQFSLTGLTTAAANAIILTASATKAMVGNGIQITGGTNFTTGIYNIIAVSAGVSITVDRNCTTASGLSGTAGLGGALASLGKMNSVATSQNTAFQKYSASAFLITSASTNVAGGCVAGWTRGVLVGYSSNRYVGTMDTLNPLNQASGISTATILSSLSCVRNIGVDGQSLTAIRGFSDHSVLDHCLAKNCTNFGFNSISGILMRCLSLGCTTQPGFTNPSASHKWCAAVNCTSVSGFVQGFFDACAAIACANGFNPTSFAFYVNCIAYGNSVDGFVANVTDNFTVINSLSYGNTGKGFNANSKLETCLFKSAAGGNTGTNIDATFEIVNGNITLTANPFVNAGATINTIEDVFTAYALNNTAGGGAACRAAGIVPYQDLGAIQHQDSGTGGGSKIFILPEGLSE